jgi:biopolymer transport protein TolR
MSARSRKKRKLKAEINVVPYIDVMLVLLIIFMVTAPLMNLGKWRRMARSELPTARCPTRK